MPTLSNSVCKQAQLKIENIQCYRNKISKMITLGYWFTLFNIPLRLDFSSRYFLSWSWLDSLAGRLYVFFSLFRYFSSFVFTLYLNCCFSTLLYL